MFHRVPSMHAARGMLWSIQVGESVESSPSTDSDSFSHSREQTSVKTEPDKDLIYPGVGLEWLKRLFPWMCVDIYSALINCVNMWIYQLNHTELMSTMKFCHFTFPVFPRLHTKILISTCDFNIQNFKLSLFTRLVWLSYKRPSPFLQSAWRLERGVFFN